MQNENKKNDAAAKEMSGAEMVLAAMADYGVEHIFGYPGGAALPIYDALLTQAYVRHILVRHEQGAVHAAEGYARSTDKIGCVLVTSGPGATNTITGLVDAMCDSIPLVVITAQVATALLGTNAFQECDITGMTKTCTKRNYLVRDIADLPRVLHEAFSLARSGRPGPVLVDIPKDVQNKKGLYYGKPKNDPIASPAFSAESIEEAVTMMRQAKRPVIYTGGGVINAGTAASETLRVLARETGFPVTSTLMGLGAFPASSPQWLGMLGMHGTYESNLAMHGADLIIAIGARFDDRVTGKVDKFAPHARKIHIDIDPASINKIVKVDLGIAADCDQVMKALVESWRARGAAEEEILTGWWQQIDWWRRKDSLSFTPSETVIKPQEALRRLNALLAGKNVYVTTDVGQHQMWVAQHLNFENPHRLMTSGGLGTMGYGLPAAIGTQIAHPEAMVVCVSGDASIQMNIQEMATAVQEKLPIKLIILNNQWMGMVRQWQELVHGERYSESYVQSQPDFPKLAEAYGWKGIACATPHQLDRALAEMLETPGPCLLNCLVASAENCFPMIPAGAAHNEMLFEEKALVSDLVQKDDARIVG